MFLIHDRTDSAGSAAPAGEALMRRALAMKLALYPRGSAGGLVVPPSPTWKERDLLAAIGIDSRGDSATQVRTDAIKAGSEKLFHYLDQIWRGSRSDALRMDSSADARLLGAIDKALSS